MNYEKKIDEISKVLVSKVIHELGLLSGLRGANLAPLFFIFLLPNN